MELTDEVAGRYARGQRIILGAIAGGALLFAGVATMLRVSGSAPQGQGEHLSLLAVALAVVAVALWRIIPPMRIAAGLRAIAEGRFRAPAGVPDDRAGQLVWLLQATTLLGAAMLEGASLFACAAYLVEDRAYVLIFGYGLPVLLWLAHSPSRERLQQWIDEQEQRLATMGAEGGSE